MENLLAEVSTFEDMKMNIVQHYAINARMPSLYIESDIQKNLSEYKRSDEDMSTTSDDSPQSSDVTENEPGSETEDEVDPWTLINRRSQRKKF